MGMGASGEKVVYCRTIDTHVLERDSGFFGMKQ